MPKHYFYIRNSIFISCLYLIIAACGNGSGSGDSFTGVPDADAPAGTTITGTATAPGGTVAKLENNYHFYNLAFDYIIRPGYAAILGLQPVTGATVELIRIDDNGNQVGDVLASTTTSITGDYSLQLPEGLELSPDLVVRITGTGVSMAAMVVEQAVDINPITEFVLQKFIQDDTIVLADIPVNQVIALRGRVEEFDLTAEADLTAMLNKLEDDLGDLAEADIIEIQRTPAEDSVRTAALGTWNLVEFSIGLHDNEEENSGTTAVDVFGTGLAITAGAEAGTLSISDGALLVDSFTNLSVHFIEGQISSNIYNEISVTSEGEEFAASIDANGNISVAQPFEEDLQTDDSQQGTGPDFGWRYPPATLNFNNTGNDNVLISSRRESGVRFDTVDTNSDGVRDAVDPESKDGDESAVTLDLLLKGGTEMSTANLDGNYGAVSLFVELASFGTPFTQVSSTVSKADFNGAGTAIIGEAGIDEVGFQRFPATLNQIEIIPFESTDGNIEAPYSVTPSGIVTLVTGEGEDLQGWTNNDSTLFALLDVTPFEEQGEVFSVTNEIMVGVKLPTTMPNLSGASYRLHGIATGADEGGVIEAFTFSRASTLTFNDSASSATSSTSLRGIDRSSDVASVVPLPADDGGVQVFEFFSPIDNMGKIAMTSQEGDEVTHLTGFVSADAKVIIFRVESIEVGDFDFRDLGLIIAVRQ